MESRLMSFRGEIVRDQCAVRRSRLRDERHVQVSPITIRRVDLQRHLRPFWLERGVHEYGYEVLDFRLLSLMVE